MATWGFYAVEKIADRILTQDNRSTEAPIFCAEELVPLYGLARDSEYSLPSGFTCQIEWRDGRGGGDGDPLVRASRLEEEALNLRYANGGADFDGWERHEVIYAWIGRAPFFTEEAAQLFILGEGGDPNKWRVYTETGNKSEEWKIARGVFCDNAALLRKEEKNKSAFSASVPRKITYTVDEAHLNISQVAVVKLLEEVSVDFMVAVANARKFGLDGRGGAGKGGHYEELIVAFRELLATFTYLYLTSVSERTVGTETADRINSFMDRSITK